MTFDELCLEHGLVLKRAPRTGSIQRCATVAFPGSTNGSYMLFDDGHGWVLNFELSDKVTWTSAPPGGFTEEQKARHREHSRQQALETARKHRQGADRAASIVKASALARSDYLVRKGFPHATALTLQKPHENGAAKLEAGTMVIPMRDYDTNALTSCELIWWDAADRKFVKRRCVGGRVERAVFRMGVIGPELFCEGYATARSISMAATLLRWDVQVVACFSCWNMRQTALHAGAGFVFADNNAPDLHGRRAGQQCAAETGLPWMCPPIEGEDANDVHQRAGLMALAQLLNQLRAQK